MNDDPHKHQGYDVLPVTDPNTKQVIGWDVPYLKASFLSKGDAHLAIEKRIAEIVADLRGRMGV